MTPAERGDLAERLIPVAALVACVVHGDGDRDDVARIIVQLDEIERDALIVVLASLVDPDRRFDEALGYVTWDEFGQRAEPTGVPLTIRQAAELLAAPCPRPAKRSVAIVENTAELAAQGLSREVIAGRLGVSWNYVQIAHSREGVQIPAVAA